MNYIKCPECQEQIPEDSRYCDMCGVELLECVKCHSLGTEAFCSECGSPMISRQKTSKQDKVNVTTGKNPQPGEGGDIGVTIGGRKKEVVLKARRGGFILKPRDGAIIGRTEGDYSNQLGSCNLISRTHAKFQKIGRDWNLIDLGSTNGCLINNVELQPNVPMKFAAGDVVDIGTYIFDAIEQ